MTSAWRFRFLHSLIFITAFCGYAYELVLAQILSILWGDVVTQYTVTTGVYIAAMGVGAFLTPVRLSAERSFIWIEVFVSLLAVAAPFCLVGMDTEFRVYATFVSYLFIATIGFLSGMELPLLLRILSKSEDKKKQTESALFMDYFGMFCAGLLFALILNRYWGTLQTSLWLAFANLGVASACGLIWGFQNKSIRRFDGPFALALFALAFWFITQNINTYQEQLEKWVIGN